MNLSLLGAIERMTKTLFIGGKVFTVNNNLNLETKGGVNIYPYIQKTLPILIATEWSYYIPDIIIRTFCI